MKYLLAIFLLVSSISFAHPPSKIQVSFSLEEKTVTIDVEHTVKGKGHYINFVEVFLNGKSIIKQNCAAQLNENGQKVIYLIPELKEDDKITILARCNIFGDMRREFVVK